MGVPDYVRRQKERKNNAGRKPLDVVMMMFKILILQSLYNLSKKRLLIDEIKDQLPLKARIAAQMLILTRIGWETLIFQGSLKRCGYLTAYKQ